MDRDSLRNSGLLEQYVLGLTSRKENELVEAVLANDPKAQADLEAIQQQFDDYASSQGANAPSGERVPRTFEEFEDLDHEMIIDLMDRNHSLNIWRFVLGSVTLLLIGLIGYLFRQNQNLEASLIHEKAEHAQDEHANGLRWQNAQQEAFQMSIVHTGADSSAYGNILVHKLDKGENILLDLSHTQPLPEGTAYYVYTKNADYSAAALLTITREQQLSLHPIVVDSTVHELRIFRYAAGHNGIKNMDEADFVADLASFED